MLAHNEEHGIDASLASLATQDLFHKGFALDFFCIVNGSSNRTAAVAKDSCSRHFKAQEEFSLHVIDIPRPGKSAAWNDFVHKFAPPDAQILVLIDADILFDRADCLRRMVETLVQDPEAAVCVDLPLKRFSRQTAVAKLSSSAGSLANRGAAKICGQLYCAKADVLRGILLPIGLMVEDGFLRASITTDNFTQSENEARVIRAEGTFHFFDAFTKPLELFTHERRIMYGTAANAVLFGYLRKRISLGETLFQIVKEQNELNPEWVKEMTQKDWFHALHVPFSFVVVPFRQLRNSPLNALPRNFAAAFVRATFSALVALFVTADMVRGRAKW
jgi:glycosyltransferase involved in cell wall biosynthesis